MDFSEKEEYEKDFYSSNQIKKELPLMRLKNFRLIHIMKPFWNMSQLIQTVNTRNTNPLKTCFSFHTPLPRHSFTSRQNDMIIYTMDIEL